MFLMNRKYVSVVMPQPSRI